jgi:hypothetical protein
MLSYFITVVSEIPTDSYADTFRSRGALPEAPAISRPTDHIPRHPQEARSIVEQVAALQAVLAKRWTLSRSMAMFRN